MERKASRTRAFAVGAAVLVVAAAARSGVAGAAAPRRAAGDDRSFATGESSESRDLVQARRLVDRSLGWLAARVRSNGALEMTSAPQQPTIAATSLAILAFMAGGHTAEEGEDGHGARLRALIHWLLGQATLQECTCTRIAGPHLIGKFNDPGFATSQMHGHGYATWAVAMADGMSMGAQNVDSRERLKRTLQGAVHAIELAQHSTGGWGYRLEAEKFHEGSVTVTVLQALRSAKEAGMRVDPAVIAQAMKYLRDSQVRQADDPRFGGFRYMLNDNLTSFALTAAAVSSLNQAGDYDSKYVELGIDYMRQKDPLVRFGVEPEQWPWYGRFYATQAYWQYKELRHFRGWYPALVAAAERESRDGVYSDDLFGDVYATAMATLTLAVPFGYLPSFQR
ncbi:MAG: hypothetical protein JNL90_09530 [Planctomycetes bacterium]|nr:hypothetical protein [Planctomycetota bacterium]